MSALFQWSKPRFTHKTQKRSTQDFHYTFLENNKWIIATLRFKKNIQYIWPKIWGLKLYYGITYQQQIIELLTFLLKRYHLLKINLNPIIVIQPYFITHSTSISNKESKHLCSCHLFIILWYLAQNFGIKHRILFPKLGFCLLTKRVNLFFVLLIESGHTKCHHHNYFKTVMIMLQLHIWWWWW